jgi:hypothetical protein
MPDNVSGSRPVISRRQGRRQILKAFFRGGDSEYGREGPQTIAITGFFLYTRLIMLEYGRRTDEFGGF